MPLYCGIDLHSNNVMISIIDAHDTLINEQRLTNDMDAIAGHLSRYQPEPVRGRGGIHLHQVIEE